MMKITHLELSHIRIPFATPYSLSKAYGVLENAEAIIFKVHTDQGIVGLGEADPMNPFTEETPRSVMTIMQDVIAPRIIGRDPTQMGMLEADLDTAVHGNTTARGGVNMALNDIVGKAYGLPAHALFGGSKHQQLPILWGIGSGTPDEDIEAIGALIEKGCQTVMVKMGALPIRDEINRMISIRERFGREIFIIVDANQGWEVSETLKFIQQTKNHPPDLIEQPVRHWDFRGLKQIRQHALCPVSADESVTSVYDAARLTQEDTVDVFSIKVSKNGGMNRSKQIASIADAFGIKCLMNSMLEFGISQAASLHVGCTLSNLLDMGHAYGSVIRMSDDVTDFSRYVTGATVLVPQGSGLGITLDEDKLKKYQIDHLKIT